MASLLGESIAIAIGPFYLSFPRLVFVPITCSKYKPMPLGDNPAALGLFRSTILEDSPQRSMLQCDNFIFIYLYPKYILCYVPILELFGRKSIDGAIN